MWTPGNNSDEPNALEIRLSATAKRLRDGEYECTATTSGQSPVDIDCNSGMVRVQPPRQLVAAPDELPMAVPQAAAMLSP